MRKLVLMYFTKKMEEKYPTVLKTILSFTRILSFTTLIGDN